MRKRVMCEDLSQTYRKILNEKKNGKVLENGDIRVGNDMALNVKTNMLYKYEY